MSGAIRKLILVAAVCTVCSLIISGTEGRHRHSGVLYVYDGMKIDGDYLIKLAKSYAGEEIFMNVVTGEGERITLERGAGIEMIGESYMADRRSKSYINPAALYNVQVKRDELGKLIEMNFFAVVRQ